MAKVTITIATDNCDRVRAIREGRIQVDGCAVLGRDIWPYGVQPNRKDIETLVRYAHEQGLAQKLQTVEELFHPSTLATSRI